MTSDNDVFERFCDACRHGDQQAAQQLLPSIDNINAFVGSNSTPLMLAVESRDVNMVRFLLDNGADVACCNRRNRTVLHHAASFENNVAVLRLLIERGAHVNSLAYSYGEMPIDLADGLANFRCLLEAGADPERALVAAAGNQHNDIVDELVERGVDVDARDHGDWTALLLAIVLNASTRCLHLLAYGANVTPCTNDCNWSSLCFAAYDGYDAACALLFAAGADVNAACRNGELPLYAALRHGECNALLLMLAAGANIHAVEERGCAEIWSHVHPRRRDIQRLLVAAGASGCPVLFKEEELSAAQAEIAAAKNEIESARRDILAARHALVVKKALPICVGLQNLRFPAFVTLAILDQLLPSRLSDVVSMHFKWAVIIAVKHFHDRRTDAKSVKPFSILQQQ